jgi:deazaflavin-dependent oxidoreductase (nitroreductase family)
MPPHPQEVLDSPTAWVAQHIKQYVETNGEQGHQFHQWPTLLLTTRGRKTGKLRRTALIYGQDRDRYILVASNAAAHKHPHWYLNLRAHPSVQVQVKAHRFTAMAHTATADERSRLWNLMAEIFPLYDQYANQTNRDIPVVILQRT